MQISHNFFEWFFTTCLFFCEITSFIYSLPWNNDELNVMAQNDPLKFYYLNLNDFFIFTAS